MRNLKGLEKNGSCSVLRETFATVDESCAAKLVGDRRWQRELVQLWVDGEKVSLETSENPLRIKLRRMLNTPAFEILSFVPAYSLFN